MDLPPVPGKKSEIEVWLNGNKCLKFRQTVCTGSSISQCFFLIWYFGYLEMCYIALFGLKLTLPNRHLIKCMVQQGTLRQQVSRTKGVWKSMIWLAELGKAFLQKNCSNLKISIQNIIQYNFSLRITILNFLSPENAKYV